MFDYNNFCLINYIPASPSIDNFSNNGSATAVVTAQFYQNVINTDPMDAIFIKTQWCGSDR